MIRPTPEAVVAADRPGADVPRDVTDWVLPRVLAGQAARRPDSLWIETTSGERSSFAQAFDEVERVAAWFASHGVTPGEHVAVMMPNGLDLVRIWLGLGRLGAVAVLLPAGT